ncbi:MAG: DNA polymerase I [Candidatus Saganbacteria bacterium]|nr:DNA polymerase I [Candidatus Saganbacteria bacterium]
MKNPKPTAPRLVLIDGNSLAYRAFYALPDTMRNSAGLTTNAIYGFTTMLLKVLGDKPDLAAISFDLAEPTFRHKAYAQYKATRDKAPPVLHQQIPYIKQIAEAFDIPIFELPGYEADDVIGTLAKAAEKQDYDVTIVTGDKDALQLVDDKIKVLHTRKGITDTVLYGPKEVKERFGIRPDQLIDLKALMGDASDNIPGVPKVGEKTAAQLLKEFGSLDEVLANIDRISKKGLKENLKKHVAQAKMSRKLAAIVTDAPIGIDFERCRQTGIDWQKALPLLEELEFDSLVRKYGQKVAAYQPENIIEKKREQVAGLDFRCVRSESELNALIKELSQAGSFAFDLETTGTDAMSDRIVGIALSAGPKSAAYIPVGHDQGKQLPLKDVLKELRSLFSSDKLKIGQNIKFDIEFLRNAECQVAGPLFDTMVAAYLIDPTSGKYSLKYLGRQLLGRDMIKMVELIGKGTEYDNFAQVPIDVAVDYACSDAEVTFSLYEIFKLALKGQKLDKLFYEVEMPLIEVLVDMELTGIRIDAKQLKQMSKEIAAKLKELEDDIHAIAGESFNINSPKQLSEILFNKLKLPVIKKTKTGASTNAEVLDELAQKFEIAAKLLDYRQLSKLCSTYVDVLPELICERDGRIHTSFNQTMTATGRLSSSDPNLQNIPARGNWGKRLRAAFVPEKKGWVMLAADYSQIELRILAHLSQDEVLLKAFKEDRDVHQATADELGISRDAAKTVNFGIIYGISDFGLAKQLKVKRTEAAEFIDRYFARHNGVKAFIDQTIGEARANGHVTTMLGRRRPIPDINNPNLGLRSFAERTAINTPVQGTAADMIKVAMVNVREKLRITNYELRMVLQVHDELVFECPEENAVKAKKLVEEAMGTALKLSVPVKVDINSGTSWAEAKS